MRPVVRSAPSIDASYRVDEDEVGSLTSYLKRPVRISSFTWSESTATVKPTASIYPWALFVGNTIIKNKLQNYSRLRGVLKLKIVINASPFYYGALRVCYDPMSHNTALDGTNQDLIPFSQMPGVWLTPQSQTSAEFTLPFLWPGNWLDLTSTESFNKIGQLSFVQYSQLQSANAAAGAGVTVTTYASMEDVEVMGPTVAAILQADEYEIKNGAISGPATAVARGAEKLSNVPVIGRFATATSVGADAVASIAKLFGYSNPPVVEDVMPYQPKSFHSFANVSTRVPLDKLALDPKNEITIDQKVVNSDEDDPLAFKNFLSRESFIILTTWTGAQAQDTLLFTAPVSPQYTLENALTSQTLVYNTPLGFASNFFKFWRGSIVYKFKFIKSKYHTGRVAISWDPENNSNTYASDQTALFTRVVDLQSEDEVSLEIPYKMPSPFALVSTTTVSTSTSPSYTFSGRAHNGVIRMRVLNTLTAPVASPSIDVLVSIHAGKDFRFNVPVDLDQTLHYGVVQSSEEDIAQSTPDVGKDMALLTIGEEVNSLRPLLLRAATYRQQPAFISGTSATFTDYSVDWYKWQALINRIPDTSGYQAGAECMDHAKSILSTGAKNYNFVANIPLNFMARCFAGLRGGVVYHISLVNAPDWVTTTDMVKVKRTLNYTAYDWAVGGAYPTWNIKPSVCCPNPMRYDSPVLPGSTGMSQTYAPTQGAISVVVPQFSRMRFLDTVQPWQMPDVTTSERFGDGVVMECMMKTASVNSTHKMIPFWDIACAAATDFTFVYFVCVPRMYRYTSPDPFSPGST